MVHQLFLLNIYASGSIRNVISNNITEVSDWSVSSAKSKVQTRKI